MSIKHKDLIETVSKHKNLADVMAWASRHKNTKETKEAKELVDVGIITEIVKQDEYSQDVIVRYDDVYIVYDTT